MPLSAICSSVPYSAASPTSTAPSRRLPSSLITIFLYTCRRSSTYWHWRLPGVLPWASPMLATSTPISLSLVLMSAPRKAASVLPAMCRAATRAIS